MRVCDLSEFMNRPQLLIAWLTDVLRVSRRLRVPCRWLHNLRLVIRTLWVPAVMVLRCYIAVIACSRVSSAAGAVMMI